MTKTLWEKGQMPERFNGDKKVGKSILTRAEIGFREWLVPRVPRCIEGYHLTLTTILWSTLIIVFSFLARYDIRWMWLTSLMIVFQYVTDLLDGALGRARDTGLVKWGYYMDHFLDYIFLCSILIGYSLLLPDHFKYILFFVLAFFGAFMVNSFLSFAATNEFKISYLGIGPTEVRIIFIAVNTLLIVFGKTYFARALPYVLGLSTFGLFVTVYRTQRDLWKIDMRDKYGDQWDAAVHDRSGSIIDQDWSLGLSKKKVLRNLGISFLLVAIALGVLMTRFFSPYHRAAAGAIYIISWIPFLWSFRQKRRLLRERGMQLKDVIAPYLPHIITAIVLLAVGYAAHILAPLEAKIPGGDLKGILKDDKNNLYILNSNMASLLNWIDKNSFFVRSVEKLSSDERKTIRELWRQFMTTFMEFDLLKNKYTGFTQIDVVTRPVEHADAFFVAYASLISQLKSSLRLVGFVGNNEFMETFLNEADSSLAIPPGSFSKMKQRITHPNELLRLNAGAVYLQLVEKHLSFSNAQVNEIKADIKKIYKHLGKSPDLLIKNPRDIFEKTAFTAWFPLQKEVAFQMSLLRTTRRKNFISRQLIARYRGTFAPGDIILERRNWYMSNVGIPGFWPHAALYIGTPAELDEYFNGIPKLAGKTASEHMRNTYPEAWRIFRSPGENGFDRCIMEALRPGAIFTSLEVSAHADYLGVIRPRLSREEKFKAILAAFSHFKKPYDYNFDFATDNSLVCSELVYKSYQEAEGLSLEPSILNGRLVITPNFLAEKFDREYGTKHQELDLVLFLDGSERSRTATRRDVAEFRKSWRRPKWDILQD